MTTLGDLVLAGQSGREYRFRVYPWTHDLKPLPAVYVVTERVVEPNHPPRYSPVFIGVTDDLSLVFENHAKSECFEVYYANTVAVLPIQDIRLRRQIVHDLFSAHSPPCNGDDPY